jgi:hypothetical protein
MKTQTTILLAALAGLTAVRSASAAVTLTYVEAPGAVNSTVQGTTVSDFNALGTQGAGVYNNLQIPGIGTANQVYLQNANQYGGATGQGVYPVQSAPPGGVGGPQAINETVLTLNKPSSYFGLWWSAGDAANTLSFYNNNTLVAQFNTQSILDLLPQSYFGNPTSAFKGQDSWEPFAFLNVYGGKGVTFNKIVFDNPGSSGFESDNWTVRQQAWGALPNDKGGYPGKFVAQVNGTKVSLTAAPEPSLTVAGLVGFALLLVAARGKARRPSLAAQTA